MIALLALLLQAQDPLDRLVSELKNPSTDRQEIARRALRAYGGPGVARLKKATLDARSLEEEDRKIVDTLKSTRVTIDMQEARLTDILEYLSQVSKLDLWIDRVAIPNPEDVVLSFRVADIVLDGALRLMLAPRGYRYRVLDGVILVTGAHDDNPLPGRRPVRLLADSPDARLQVAGLSGETPEERDKATENLRRLGFAAEPALWEALASKDAEARGRARDLLGELYTPDVRLDDTPAEKTLQSKQIPCRFAHTPPAKVLADLSEATGLSIVVDPGKPLPTYGVNFQAGGMRGSALLAKVTFEFGRTYFALRDCIVVTHELDRILGTRPYGPVWTEAGKARAIEDAIGRLASDDAARHAAALEEILKMDPLVLGPLLQGSRILAPAAAERCRAARERYVESKGLWLPDEPSGADLQDLSDAQKKLLSKTVDLQALGEPLEAVLKRAGIRADLKARPASDLHLWVKGLPTRSLLQAVTRPCGLDFRLDGDTIVVDTAANVRAAVTK